MDIDLLRTFLQITEAGHFIRAAERLNVTQSTVSARVRELELRLGRTLFLRGRSGAVLTPAGRHFLPHAASMVRIWNQARHEVGLPQDYETVLAAGGQFTLWDGVLQRWLAWMRRAAPRVALRAEVGRPDELSRMLSDGTLDLAVLYAPQPRPGLRIEPLLDERLVLVASRAVEPWPGGSDYIFVDWGPDFHADHAAAFPEIETPALTVGLGAIALAHIVAAGGSGYFPIRIVTEPLQAGVLTQVPGAPEFARRAFVVWQERDDLALEDAVRGLREVAATEAG